MSVPSVLAVIICVMFYMSGQHAFLVLNKIMSLFEIKVHK